MPPLINDHPLTSQSHKYHQFRRAEGGAATRIHNIVVFIEVLIISTIIKIDRNYMLCSAGLSSAHHPALLPALHHLNLNLVVVAPHTWSLVSDVTSTLGILTFLHQPAPATTRLVCSLPPRGAAGARIAPSRGRSCRNVSVRVAARC